MTWRGISKFSCDPFGQMERLRLSACVHNPQQEHLIHMPVEYDGLGHLVPVYGIGGFTQGIDVQYIIILALTVSRDFRRGDRITGFDVSVNIRHPYTPFSQRVD